MRQLVGLLPLLLVGAGACWQGDDETAASTTTTTTSTVDESPSSSAQECDIPHWGFEHDAPEDCWLELMEFRLSQVEASLTDVSLADDQARLVCERLDDEGADALYGTLDDWRAGTLDEPVDTPFGRRYFLATAVGVYCPQHYPLLTVLG